MLTTPIVLSNSQVYFYLHRPPTGILNSDMALSTLLQARHLLLYLLSFYYNFFTPFQFLRGVAEKKSTFFKWSSGQRRHTLSFVVSLRRLRNSRWQKFHTDSVGLLSLLTSFASFIVFFTNYLAANWQEHRRSHDIKTTKINKLFKNFAAHISHRFYSTSFYSIFRSEHKRCSSLDQLWRILVLNCS